jgi:hypothetical protein
MFSHVDVCLHVIVSACCEFMGMHYVVAFFMLLVT